MLTELTNAYEAALQEQARLRNKTVSPFDREVALSIFTAGLLAIEDSARGVAQYRVISAPTGSGKSSYAQAFIRALIQVYPNGSVLFLVETIQQAEDTYQSMSSLLGHEAVAIWTSAHNLDISADAIQQEYGFVPARRFKVDELATYPVVIATHSFYKTSKRAGKATSYRDQPRTITFIDENIAAVSIYDVDTGLVKTVRDRIAEKYGSTHPHVEQLTQLHNHLERLWQSTSGKASFDEIPETGKVDLDWFKTDQASNYIASTDEQVRQVIGFGRALADGFAFLSRYDEKGKGARFVGYEMNMPLRPGMILLDATADIDGVSLIVSNRLHVKVPHVDFRNLHVTHIEPDILKGARVSEALNNATTAKLYAEWIRDTIIGNSQPGEEVLAVVHKRLLDENYLPNNHREFGDAFDLFARKVCFIHWGSGIGSNRWKCATSVFLFGEFHIPKRAIVGTDLGLRDEKATVKALTRFQTPNKKGKGISAIQEGHLCRWMKQLSMRGNARNIDGEGVCGYQRLYVTCELERLIRHKGLMFPNANLSVRCSSDYRKHRGAVAIAYLLYTTEANELTTLDVQRLTGTSIQKNKNRYLSNPILKAAMRDTVFSFVSGGGRGKPGVFSRITARNREG